MTHLLYLMLKLKTCLNHLFTIQVLTHLSLTLKSQELEFDPIFTKKK